MREQRLSRLRGDDGAAAIIVAVLAVVLVGTGAFAVDLGNAYATNRILSTAADGAALAAAQELGASGLRCGGAVSAADAATARAVADDYSTSRNAPGSQLLQANGFVLSCDPSDGNGRVTVRNTKAVPFAFGAIFGLSSANPQGVATAKYGEARTVTGLRPFGLCVADPAVISLLAQGVPGATPSTVRVEVDKTKDGNCGNAPGNWGVLDLAGGNNATPNIRTWIENGYPDELDLVGDSILGNPGAPSGGSLGDAMDSIVGDQITLPVYDTATKSGSNARFHIVSFVSATLCGWKFGNKTDKRSQTCRLPDATRDGANDPDYLELRFEESFSVGDFQVCPVTGCAVSSGVINLQLVENP